MRYGRLGAPRGMAVLDKIRLTGSFADVTPVFFTENRGLLFVRVFVRGVGSMLYLECIAQRVRLLFREEI